MRPLDHHIEPECSCRPCSCGGPGGYCTTDCDGLECEWCRHERLLADATKPMRTGDPSADDNPDILF